jgi:glycosyltransferase involved in cell wall biosynthesis
LFTQATDKGLSVNKFLSICIPTYNRADTLQQALNSILPQIANREDVEIVILDNASSDGTQAVVKEYMQRHLRLRYLRQAENIGFSGNVVSCIKQAQGEYISFFSDDDIALPGTFPRVFDELAKYKPAILYLNHYPFRGQDHSQSLGLKLASRDIQFQSGKEFLLFAGLGFISALTIRTEYAREFVSIVKPDRNEAHLEIAARIALFKEGPFLFLGTLPVAARAPAQVVGDHVTFAAINEARLYHELEADGLLDHESVRQRVGGTIHDNLLRTVLTKKCLGDHKHLASQKGLLIETYGRYPSFYIYVYPVLILPRAFLVPLYYVMRALYRVRQKRRYG